MSFLLFLLLWDAPPHPTHLWQLFNYSSLLFSTWGHWGPQERLHEDLRLWARQKKYRGKGHSSGVVCREEITLKNLNPKIFLHPESLQEGCTTCPEHTCAAGNQRLQPMTQQMESFCWHGLFPQVTSAWIRLQAASLQCSKTRR